MLSNKWTFSLMSLVVLIAFGLVYVVPSAMADGDIPDAGRDFYDIGVTIAAGETMVDVSAEDGFQIATGRDRAARGLTDRTRIYHRADLYVQQRHNQSAYAPRPSSCSTCS